MPVLTSKEYNQKKKEEKKEVTGNKVIKKIELPVIDDKPKIIYKLGFPEILQNGSKANFKNSIILNGNKCNYECIEGLVKTENEDLAKYLISRGYIILKEMEINNG